MLRLCKIESSNDIEDEKKKKEKIETKKKNPKA